MKIILDPKEKERVSEELARQGEDNDDAAIERITEALAGIYSSNLTEDVKWIVNENEDEEGE